MRPKTVGPFTTDEFLARLATDHETVVRDVANHAIFERFFNAGRGILIERDEAGLWDLSPVSAWNEAYEAERRRP